MLQNICRKKNNMCSKSMKKLAQYVKEYYDNNV